MADEMVRAFVGEVRLFAFEAIPNNWIPCDGRTLNIRDHEPLFALFYTSYGGDGKTTFAVPDLRGRVPVHQNGPAGSLGQAGSGNGPAQPYEALVYAIANGGMFPSRGGQS